MRLPAVLFVDDVLLAAKSPPGLQRLLDIATKWAEDRQMTWNTKPGKSEVLEAVETRSSTFTLAGQPLGKAEEVKYLGVGFSLL